MRSARMRCDASAGTAAAGAVPSVCVLMASGLEQEREEEVLRGFLFFGKVWLLIHPGTQGVI